MDKVNKIINNIKYCEYIKRIETAEIDRIYCRHNMDHFMDVARIAVIIANDEDILLEREHIYAAALLHDIGRFVQYENGTAHEEASAQLAVDILEECGFNKAERDLIIEAIREHGNSDIMWDRNLTGCIYRADKLSRKCYCCTASATCHKAADKRNLVIKL